MSYSVWQSFITNGVETISGAVVSVFHEVSGAPAALFSSPSGGSIGSSVTSDSSGLARFYVAAVVYRITVTHASFSAEHRHVRIGQAAADALRAFVHVQEIADAVASAMAEVYAFGP